MIFLQDGNMRNYRGIFVHLFNIYYMSCSLHKHHETQYESQPSLELSTHIEGEREGRESNK